MKSWKPLQSAGCRFSQFPYWCSLCDGPVLLVMTATCEDFIAEVRPALSENYCMLGPELGHVLSTWSHYGHARDLSSPVQHSGVNCSNKLFSINTTPLFWSGQSIQGLMAIRTRNVAVFLTFSLCCVVITRLSYSGQTSVRGDSWMSIGTRDVAVFLTPSF